VSLVKISYQKDGVTPAMVITPLVKTRYSYNRNGSIIAIMDSSGLSTTYHYKGGELRKLQIGFKGKQAEYLFGEYGVVQSSDFHGRVARYNYTNGRINSVNQGKYGKINYIYDNNDRIQKIHYPGGGLIEYRYKKKKEPFAEHVVTKIYHPNSTSVSSSPVVTVKPSRKDVKLASTGQILKERERDDIVASRNLINGVIIDLFVDKKGSAHLMITDSNGVVENLDSKASGEFRRLINIAANAQGKLGSIVSWKWGKFFDKYLAKLVRPTYLQTPDGKKVKLKPPIVIRSNEVNLKYANLEKVSPLSNNFIVYITTRDSASNLVAKINNIPRLSRDNVVFAIRLPKMSQSQRKDWIHEVGRLRKILGMKNVLFDPSKEEFTMMLEKKRREIIVFELIHTGEGLLLKNEVLYNSGDVLRGGDLSHIKYLIGGIGCCRLPSLEEGRFITSLREQGVGIINATNRDISTDTALRKIRILGNILEEGYEIPTSNLLDIINQLLGISDNGTTNLGMRTPQRKFALG